MCSKFNSSQSKTYFSQFFDKLSNWGNGISNSLCEVWNVNSLILSKLHILFSTVTLKLGHKCSQFIHIFKIRIFWVLALGCTYKLFPIYNEILGFLNVALAGLLNFSQFMKNIENYIFLNISLGCTSKFFPIHLRFEKLGLLKSHWFHILLDCEGSLSDTVCLQKREGDPIYDLIASFQEKEMVVFT